MNVLINLLPDTRQVKQKNSRRRQLLTGVAVALWAVCGGILVVLMLYAASQKLLINNLTSQINDKQAQLKGIEGLTDALTAQQHLASLPGLYSQRAYFTKFFDAYTQANPSDVTLTSMTIDATNTLSVNGNAKSYNAAAKLAKALEAENITVGKNASQGNQPYFTNVAISSATRSNNQISFTLTATLDAGVTSGK